ncbi:recombinase family protein [Streptomyces sp. NPDC003344]|uniref:recombinase family protein n=1 Tax=Streptomyces sp. NPDC003344 TaxID=3364682 RepID=UPI0036989823
MAKYEAGWGKPQAEPGRLRAAIMTRLSRDSEDSTSIATQEDDGRTLCRLRGWDVVVVTYDVGVSGSVRPEERPGFGVILENLRHVDVVVARSLDRFSRSTSHFATLVETLDKGGTTLADVQGQVDLTSPYGRFVTTIMVAFAQMEREVIQTRILRSRAELRRAGRWLGGAAPYGYRIVPDGFGGKRLEVDETSGEVLRGVIKRVISGVTLSQEVARLNREGVLSPLDYRKALRGELPPPAPGYAEWTYSPLRDLLRSDVIRGVRVIGKRKDRRAVRDGVGAPVRVGTALVDDATFFRLQKALDAASVDPRRPRRKATLLLHIAWCPNCDETLYYNSRQYGDERRDVYACPAVRDKRLRDGGVCPGVTATAKHLERHVEEWLLATYGRIPFKERIRVGGVGDRSAVVDELNADIEELAESLVGLRGAAKAAVLTQLEARQEALDELQREPVEPERWEWVPTGRTVAQEWEAAEDVAERRLLLLSLGIRANVAPANGRRRWDPERVTVGRHEDDPEAARLMEILEEETVD